MEQELSAILQEDVTDTTKAINAFAWGTRGQFFWDGNKQTSLMLANKILIVAGAGIMTITDKYLEEFNGLLLDYYDTGKSDNLKIFLYEKTIHGIELA